MKSNSLALLSACDVGNIIQSEQSAMLSTGNALTSDIAHDQTTLFRSDGLCFPHLSTDDVVSTATERRGISDSPD